MRTKQAKKTFFYLLLLKSGFVLFAIYTIVSFLVYWDPTRLILARLKAESPYVFDKVHPTFLKTNPKSLISINNKTELNAKRNQLIKLIWGKGGFPSNKLPSHVSKNFLIFPKRPLLRPKSNDQNSFIALFDKLEVYKGLENLQAIHRLTINDRENWTAYAGVFLPQNSNNRLVIYQNGFASTYHNQWRIIGDLIRKGFTVVAHNFRWYGLNRGTYKLKSLEHPLKGFFEPVIVSINFMEDRMAFKSVDIIGLSAGAWVSVMAAAIDSRISRSYPISGISPVYLREGNESPLPKADSLILPIASYLDIFLIGASGPGRGQIQVYNQFDRCCYRNQKNKLYEKAIIKTVKSIGAGRFGIIIDRSHARHKISRYAFNKILADINRDD